MAMHRYGMKDATGRIYSISDMDVDSPPSPDWVALPADAEPNQYFWSNGSLHEYTEQERARLAAHPGPSYYEWNQAGREWVDPRPLADKKLAKKTDMRRAREADEYSTFTYNGWTFDCDKQSTQRIMGAVQLAILANLNSQAFSIDWTLADDTTVTLDAAQMLAVGQALATHVNGKHNKYRQKLTAIQNAGNETALNAITWD